MSEKPQDKEETSRNGSRGDEEASAGDSGEGPAAEDTGTETKGGGHGWSGWGSSLSGVPDMVADAVDAALRGLGPVTGSRFPRYDLIRVPGEGYRVLMDLPGIDKAELDVTTEGDELTVAGRRERPRLEEGSEFVRSECSYGRFRRTIRMPSDVSMGEIRAKLDEGVLRLTLPRRGESEAQHVEVEG